MMKKTSTINACGLVVFMCGLLNGVMMLTNIAFSSVFTTSNYAIPISGSFTFYLTDIQQYVFRYARQALTLENGAVFVVMFAISFITLTTIGWKMTKLSNAPDVVMGKSSSLLVYVALNLGLGMLTLASISALNLLEFLIPAFISVACSGLVLHICTASLEDDNDSMALSSSLELLFAPLPALVTGMFPAISVIQTYASLNVQQGDLPMAYSAFIIGGITLFTLFYAAFAPWMLIGNRKDSHANILGLAIYVTIWNLYISWFFFAVDLSSRYINPITGLDLFLNL
jgi:hypothetical protein